MLTFTADPPCNTGNAQTSREAGKKIYLIQERHLVAEGRQVQATWHLDGLL